MGELLAIKKGGNYHKSIDITAMLDPSLSLQAKGLHYYMQTRPDNWKIWFSNLVKFSTNGETSVRSALKELSDTGYLIRVQLRNEKKQVMRMIYISLEKPDTFSKLDLENLHLENLDLGFKVHSYNIYSYNIGRVSLDTNKDSSNPSNLLNSSIEKGEQPKKEYKIPFLLKEWRTYPQVPTSQHHPKEDTKIHKRINYLTTLFLKGKVGAVCTKFDPTFLKKNNIDAYKLNYTYSEDELLAGLDEMSKMFLEGNYPENKDSISKRSFDSLLYCNRTHMSYFMRYLWNNVIPLPYKTVKVWDNWLDELYDQEIFDKEIETDNHQFGILKRGLKGIEDYYDWMVENPLKGYNFEQINDEDKFFNGYVEWLIERGFTNLTPYDIGPQNNKWYQFIKWLEEAIHGDFTHQFPTWNKRNYEK